MSNLAVVYRGCAQPAFVAFPTFRLSIKCCVCEGYIIRGKRVYTTTVAPLFSQSVARPRGHRAKKAMVHTIFLGKQGKRVYTIGPERRVYTIEPQTRKKKKGRVSTVVVYTFFFSVLGTGPPNPTLESASLSPPQGSICIDLTSIRHRFDIDLTSISS